MWYSATIPALQEASKVLCYTIGTQYYCLKLTEQRKGFAKEALNGILFFLFETNDIHRVVEIVDAENMALINLLRSTGFRQKGHFIENIFFKGKWGSEYKFAMLKKERVQKFKQSE